MESVGRHSTKTVEEYRHNIKLLKYHLKKQQKVNQTLRYKEVKHHKKETASKISQPPQKQTVYGMAYTVNLLNQKVKDMGIVLADIFRMADQNYEGEITKEQFMRTILKLKAPLEENLINQMFYAIDTNLNGMLSADQYVEFLSAHGGSESKEAMAFQRQAAQKLAAALKKKNIKVSEFLSRCADPCLAEEVQLRLKDLKLNANECMSLLKLWDPSLEGSLRHQVFLKSMEDVKQKDQKQIQNERFEKGVQELCVLLRDRKINPITIFQQSQADGKPGISQYELEQGLRQLLPDETPFQIRKWVKLINLNGDNEITREEFLSAIKSFYSIQQITKFSADYDKLHPKLKQALDDQTPPEKIIEQLSNAIEDSGFTKTEVFHRIDINHNGLVDKEELLEGLKHMGIKIGLIARVLTVFDRDASGEVALEEWLSILGEEVEMEEVQVDVPQKTKEEPKIKQEKAEKKVVKKQVKAPSNLEKKQNAPNSSKIKETTALQKKGSSLSKTSLAKKNEPLKDQDKNKNVKEAKGKSIDTKAVKKPIESTQPQKKPSFAEDQAPYIKQQLKQTFSENQQEKEVNIEEFQKEVAKVYGQSKKKTMSIFKTVSKSKRGINQKQLSKCLSDLRLKTQIEEQQVTALFQNNISSNGTFEYQAWLDQLIEKYGIEVSQQPVEDSKPIQKKTSQSKQTVQKYAPSKPNIPSVSQLPNQSQVERYSESYENESRVKQKGVKRGERNKQFQEVSTLVVQNQVHSEQGYRLSTFIGSEEQLTLLNNQYLPLSNKIKANKKKYQDKSFKPALSSLTDCNPLSNSKIQDVSLLKWKHYSQLYSSPKLFKDGIQPNDISQGQLGDCYFLCSLAGLAQYRRLIQRLFQYYDLDNGYFLVWLCIDGYWKLIEVDGFIPVKPNGKAAVFSRSREGDQQLWVMLLEKAYAKVYGCYEHIIGGQPFEAIKDLSGAPGQSFSHKSKGVDPQMLWQKLCLANESEFIMTCGTDESEKGQFKLSEHSQSVTTEGIVIGHAYSILDVAIYQGEKLIQLRNPWGTMEWKGPWSDNSKEWTTQAKTALGYGDFKDDGIFWMPYSTYYQYYATTAINYIRPNYFYSCQRKTKIKNIVVKFPARAIKHGFVMVAQQDHRKRGLPSNTPYNLSHLIAINYLNGEAVKKLADEKYMHQREGCVQINSKQVDPDSEFVVLVSLESPTDVNLCTYADSKFEYEVDDSYENMLHYIEAVAGIEANAKNVQTDSKNTFKNWLTSVGEYAFLVFKNITKKDVTVTIELTKPNNLSLLDGMKSTLRMKPGCSESIKGKISELKQPFSFGPMMIV